MTIENKPKANMWIVGINLLVMLLYSAALYSQRGDGLIAMWLLMLAHVAISLIVGIVSALMIKYKHNAMPWFLSAITILLIGLSTCYAAVSGLK